MTKPTESQSPAGNLYRLPPEQVAFIEQMLEAIPASGPLGQLRKPVATADGIKEALAWPVTAENTPGEKT